MRKADATSPLTADSQIGSREHLLSHARRLVLAHSWNPIAYQILNPGIELWFSEARDGVIGYVRYRKIRVVAGAPVCDPSRIREVAGEFEDDARTNGERVCYFHVGPRFLEIIRGSPQYSFASIGALPYWNPTQWSSVLASDASLRYQISRAKHKGIISTELSAEAAASSMPLREIREQWLHRKHLPPLHFLVEPEIFDLLSDRRLFVAERNGQMLAYLLCSPMPNRNGWLFEQWARGDDAPLGTSELLVHAAMSTFAEEGCTTVTMGLTPLSEKTELALGEPGPPWLCALFRFLRWSANPLYNFKGLEHYKYKLRPQWSEAVYAAVNDDRFRFINVFAIAHAFAGSPLQLFAWRSIRKMIESLYHAARGRSS